MESTSPCACASASASAAMVEPQAVQRFTDADSYKAAKQYLLDYAEATKSTPGVRCYRLIDEYHNKVLFWFMNGGADVNPERHYVLDGVGRVAEICLTGTDRSRIKNVVIDGAIFYKEATFGFPARSVELCNCTWQTLASSVAVDRSVKAITVTNPTGSAVVKPTLFGGLDLLGEIKHGVDATALAQHIADSTAMARLICLC